VHPPVLHVHDISPDELSDELSDELTTLLTEQLDDTGVLRGQPEFELVFTGIVRTTVDGGMPAWLQFYRNSLDALERGVATFAPIHQRAHSLLTGRRLVDLGSCFGFFPLRAAANRIDTVATDLSGPTMQLLARMSGPLGRPIQTICCDAARVPLPDGDADTVTVLHLLEHLSPGATDAVIDEAIRLARRRVVIAVTFEDVPRACYGHIQRFDAEALRRLAKRLCDRHPELRTEVAAHHGGWLVIDR
jgi:Methyltransferase domain